MAETMLLKDEVYAIVGAAIEVHRELRSGFLESVYQEAMELELSDRKIAFEAQKQLTVNYKGSELKHKFVADLVCFGSVIVELKAVEGLNSEHEAQLLNYLRATGQRVGVLINFGRAGKLEWKRFVV